MLHQKSLSEKGIDRRNTLFFTFKIGHLLRQAGIRKSFGMSALSYKTAIAAENGSSS
jgi:hypothetical protein